MQQRRCAKSQQFGRDSEDIQKVLLKRKVYPDKKRERWLRKQNLSHVQGGCNISAFIPNIARMAKKAVNRDMKSAIRPQLKLVAFVGHVRNHKGSALVHLEE